MKLGNVPTPVEHLRQPPFLRKMIRSFYCVALLLTNTCERLTRSVRDFQLHLAFPCPARLCTQAAPSLKYPSTGLSLTLGGVVHSSVVQPRLPPLSIGWAWLCCVEWDDFVSPPNRFSPKVKKGPRPSQLSEHRYLMFRTVAPNTIEWTWNGQWW